MGTRAHGPPRYVIRHMSRRCSSSCFFTNRPFTRSRESAKFLRTSYFTCKGDAHRPVSLARERPRARPRAFFAQLRCFRFSWKRSIRARLSSTV